MPRCKSHHHRCRHSKRPDKKQEDAYASVLSLRLQEFHDNAQRVIFEQDTALEHIENEDEGILRVQKDGAYVFCATLRIAHAELDCCRRWFDTWYRVNGFDVENSRLRQQVLSVCDEPLLISKILLELKKGDVVTVMGRAEARLDLVPIIDLLPGGPPAVPSAKLLAYRVGDVKERKKHCKCDSSSSEESESSEDEQ